MTICQGVIRNLEPIVTATIDENRDLNFLSAGTYRFVIDTGFTGDIAVPSALIPKLNLKFSGYSEFLLATHKNIKLPVFKGVVKVKNKRVKVDIVPGDELLGMGFLAAIGTKMIVDFKNATVKLIG